MIAISSDDFNDFLCPNLNCKSSNFGSILDKDEYSIIKCGECGEEFYVSFTPHSIWQDTGDKDDRGNPIINEIPVIKHPKCTILEDSPWLKKHNK